jgi:hypothetical protein
MTFAYMMAFLDKQALSYTAIMGLRTDLNLKGSEYGWSGSIFYFGYLFFSYPASILMVKFPLGKYLACNLSVILTLTLDYTDYHPVCYGLLFWLAMPPRPISPGSWWPVSSWDAPRRVSPAVSV